MAILQNWLPPSRENWELICSIWAYFPLVRLPNKFLSYAAHMHLLIEMLQVTTAQWVLDWYPQGKTSIESKWNIDGRWGWATMESAGFVVLLYIMYALPRELGIGELPWGSWTMAGCFVSSPKVGGVELIDRFGYANQVGIGGALHLPRDSVAAVPQSEHVAHASVCVDHGIRLPSREWDFHRRIPRGLRAHGSIPLGRAVRVHVYWAGHLVLGTIGQHVSRRRPARDPARSKPQAATRGKGVWQAR
jgi:hypothetical protein